MVKVGVRVKVRVMVITQWFFEMHFRDHHWIRHGRFGLIVDLYVEHRRFSICRIRCFCVEGLVDRVFKCYNRIRKGRFGLIDDL